MKKQMEFTRRARHDLKHHMKAVHTMAENNECKKNYRVHRNIFGTRVIKRSLWFIAPILL